MVNGTVTKIVLWVDSETDDSSDLSNINIHGTMYVADNVSGARDGLGIDLGDTDASSVAPLLANSKADLYTLATTGALPLD